MRRDLGYVHFVRHLADNLVREFVLMSHGLLLPLILRPLKFLLLLPFLFGHPRSNCVVDLLDSTVPLACHLITHLFCTNNVAFLRVALSLAGDHPLAESHRFQLMHQHAEMIAFTLPHLSRDAFVTVTDNGDQ